MNKVFELQKPFTHEYKNIKIVYKSKLIEAEKITKGFGVLEVRILDYITRNEYIIYHSTADKIRIDLTNDAVKRLMDEVITAKLIKVKNELNEKERIKNEKILKIKRLVDEFRF